MRVEEANAFTAADYSPPCGVPAAGHAHADRWRAARKLLGRAFDSVNPANGQGVATVPSGTVVHPWRYRGSRA